MHYLRAAAISFVGIISVLLSSYGLQGFADSLDEGAGYCEKFNPALLFNTAPRTPGNPTQFVVIPKDPKAEDRKDRPPRGTLFNEIATPDENAAYGDRRYKVHDEWEWDTVADDLDVHGSLGYQAPLNLLKHILDHSEQATGKTARRFDMVYLGNGEIAPWRELNAGEQGSVASWVLKGDNDYIHSSNNNNAPPLNKEYWPPWIADAMNLGTPGGEDHALNPTYEQSWGDGTDDDQRLKMPLRQADNPSQPHWRGFDSDPYRYQPRRCLAGPGLAHQDFHAYEWYIPNRERTMVPTAIEDGGIGTLLSGGYQMLPPDQFRWVEEEYALARSPVTKAVRPMIGVALFLVLLSVAGLVVTQLLSVHRSD